jgi:hypothetical protein
MIVRNLPPAAGDYQRISACRHLMSRRDAFKATMTPVADATAAIKHGRNNGQRRGLWEYRS